MPVDYYKTLLDSGKFFDILSKYNSSEMEDILDIHVFYQGKRTRKDVDYIRREILEEFGYKTLNANDGKVALDDANPLRVAMVVRDKYKTSLKIIEDYKTFQNVVFGEAYEKISHVYFNNGIVVDSLETKIDSSFDEEFGSIQDDDTNVDYDVKTDYELKLEEILQNPSSKEYKSHVKKISKEIKEALKDYSPAVRFFLDDTYSGIFPNWNEFYKK